MYLQVMAVEQPQAGVVMDTLKQKGFPAVLAQSPNATLFRVMVGPYADAASSGQSQSRTRKRGLQTSRAKIVRWASPLVQISGSPRAVATRPRLPEWARKTSTHFESLHQSEARSPPAQSAYGLRIGALPKYPRVLPSRRRHFHDSWQPLHAWVRILLGAQRLACKTGYAARSR